jgi:hypothetical protein
MTVHGSFLSKFHEISTRRMILLKVALVHHDYGGAPPRFGTELSMIPREAIAEHPDTSLLPGESKDLSEDVLKVVGEEWLLAKNLYLGNRAPNELIGTPEEFRVRNMLRSFLVAALS